MLCILIFSSKMSFSATSKPRFVACTVTWNTWRTTNARTLTQCAHALKLSSLAIMSCSMMSSHRLAAHRKLDILISRTWSSSCVSRWLSTLPWPLHLTTCWSWLPNSGRASWATRIVGWAFSTRTRTHWNTKCGKTWPNSRLSSWSKQFNVSSPRAPSIITGCRRSTSGKWRTSLGIPSRRLCLKRIRSRPTLGIWSVPSSKESKRRLVVASSNSCT